MKDDSTINTTAYNIGVSAIAAARQQSACKSLMNPIPLFQLQCQGLPPQAEIPWAVSRDLMRLITTIAFLSFFLSSCGQKVKETFLVPAGFQGRINVIFNQPNAPAIPVENGRRIYHIPTDGVLITSSKLETGFIDQEYYYIDKEGKRTKIAVQDLNAKDVPKKPTVVYYGVTGVYGNSTDTNPLNFAESIIASRATNDSINSQQALAAFDETVKRKVGRSF